MYQPQEAYIGRLYFSWAVYSRFITPVDESSKVSGDMNHHFLLTKLKVSFIFRDLECSVSGGRPTTWRAYHTSDYGTQEIFAVRPSLETYIRYFLHRGKVIFHQHTWQLFPNHSMKEKTQINLKSIIKCSSPHIWKLTNTRGSYKKHPLAQALHRWIFFHRNSSKISDSKEYAYI